MAIVTINLPLCDVCGEITLPSADSAHKGISARADIRAYDEARKKDGFIGYRCGKCKSPRWDRNFTGDRRRKDPFEGMKPAKPAPLKFAATRKCKHGLLVSLCKQCQKG